ncbi:MAG TPA: heavy metal-associated domain-containing protein [Phycisphaerales bacterium]|nr:heavy metal-associated domain-containing protein [Phycisphaerales bacterium]
MKTGLRSTVMQISGMRGDTCRERVAAVLKAVAGVETVDVTLYRAKATIVHDSRCDAAALSRAVRQAGYIASVSQEGGGVAPRTNESLRPRS